MPEKNLKINDPLGLGLSILLNIMITAFGAPIGPLIVAFLIGLIVGGVIVHNHHRAGQ